MIANLLAGLLAASDSEGNSFLMLLLGPVGGVATYTALWQYCRNADKSHAFERETRIDAKPPTGNDRKIDEIKGTKKTAIDGDNKSDHRRRVHRV